MVSSSRNAVGHQIQLVGQAKLVDLDTRQVTDLSLPDPRIAGNRLNRFVKVRLLPGMKFLDGAREGRGDEKAHQPN